MLVEWGCRVQTAGQVYEEAHRWPDSDSGSNLEVFEHYLKLLMTVSGKSISRKKSDQSPQKNEQ